MQLILSVVVALLEGALVSSVRLRSNARPTTLLQRARGEPVGTPASSMPAPPSAVSMPQGFCKRPDNTSACSAVKNCCCWSTFGVPDHIAYPNPDDEIGKRKCVNPPVGFIYVKEPGAVRNGGQVASMTMDNVPLLEGRSLCCTIREYDPDWYSLRGGLAAVNDLTDVLYLTTGPPVTEEKKNVTKQKSAEVDEWSYADADEYETLAMEEAAKDHLKAADEVSEAAAMMKDSVKDLEDIKDAQEFDKAVAEKKVRIKAMHDAVKIWSEKSNKNLEILKAPLVEHGVME